MDSFILIDDRDPRVYYNENDGWVASGSTAEFGSTTHGVGGDKGARALLTFTGTPTYHKGIQLSRIKFLTSGTSVVVYGTVPHDTPGNSTYIIDGATSSTFINPISSDNIYQQTLYQSPRLENTQHTLTIMPLTDGVFWLDYFKVTQPPPTLASDQFSSNTREPSPVTSYSGSSLSDSSTVSGTMSTIIASVPVQSLRPPSQTRNSLKAIIAGSVTGGILVGLVIAFFVWRRHKRRNAFKCVCTYFSCT